MKRGIYWTILEVAVVLFLLQAFFACLLGCDACQSPPPPQSQTPADIAWYAMLDAGMEVPDPNGPSWVAKQLEAGAPKWLTCLSLNKPVAACQVPRPGGDAGAGN